ncbi:Cytochrome P450 [Corchorus olitorius]|uniref:Cytochrome P450 n=1 Tax=Corchorus olitorius TaxID=93759 RepID=A0A1R3HIJ5_9ROSI|nr:Cytochrome P450 [Corchorus olitorius]
MAPYTPLWKFMRKFSMTQVLGTRSLDRLHPLKREEIKRFIKILQEKSEAAEAVDIGAELVRLTNNITLRMLLSRYEDEEANELLKIVAEMTGIITKVNLSDYFWFCKSLGLLGFRRRLKDVRDRFDILVDKFILEHKEARKKDGRIEDVLDILIDISEDENAEMKLTNDNIKALISNYLTGGTDTFPLTICWGLAQLINHPEVMKKAQKEIDSVVGRNRILEESDVENLPYLKAIVKETLRLHPGGPLVVRESTEDCSIGGYEIPGGTTLFVNVWALGKDPKQWENHWNSYQRDFLVMNGGRGGMERTSFWILGDNIIACCHLGVEEEAALELHWHYKLSQQSLGI